MNFKLNKNFKKNFDFSPAIYIQIFLFANISQKNITLSKNSLFKGHIALHQNKKIDGMI